MVERPEFPDSLLHSSVSLTLPSTQRKCVTAVEFRCEAAGHFSCHELRLPFLYQVRQLFIRGQKHAFVTAFEVESSQVFNLLVLGHAPVNYQALHRMKLRLSMPLGAKLVVRGEFLGDVSARIECLESDLRAHNSRSF